MAFRHSSLASLAKIRKAGQRPDMPVVVSDNQLATHWGLRNGFCVVRRDDIAEDLSAFSGLDVFVVTLKPFGEVVEFAKELEECARYVTLVDGLHRRRSEFL